MRPEFFFVFDVESIGLHGEAFAVGGVIVDRSGSVLEDFLFSCEPKFAKGNDEDRKWVGENVLPTLPGPNLETPLDVREAFWAVWERWRARGAIAVADVPWPVEANLLSACISDDRDGRLWSGPYPLYDVASVVLTTEKDPVASQSRLPDEQPAHNPLCDARQSARLFREALLHHELSKAVIENNVDLRVD